MLYEAFNEILDFVAFIRRKSNYLFQNIFQNLIYIKITEKRFRYNIGY